jgi:hypothetical protein
MTVRIAEHCSVAGDIDVNRGARRDEPIFVWQ